MSPARATGDGVVPGGGPNERFPGYDVLAQAGTWDTATSGVVLARLGPLPPIRFFSPAEEAVGAALFDQLLDQRGEPKVPVLEMVDARLAEHITDGWRHTDMPDDGDAFRLTFAGLDADAEHQWQVGFAAAGWERQGELLQRVQDLAGAGDTWRDLPAKYVWSLWTRYACAAFYSHPWAWNEIGFGGPAYPRGYKNLGLDAREGWEVRDRSDGDPVVFAGQVEQSRRARAKADRVE